MGREFKNGTTKICGRQPNTLFHILSFTFSRYDERLGNFLPQKLILLDRRGISISKISFVTPFKISFK